MTGETPGTDILDTLSCCITLAVIWAVSCCKMSGDMAFAVAEELVKAELIASFIGARAFEYLLESEV
jgi:hypothetical protein